MQTESGPSVVKPMVWIVMLFAAIGGMLYGYDIGVISGAFLFVKDSIPMDDIQMSLLAGAVLGGGALATLVSGVLSDWLGRKRMIMFAAVIFVLSVFLIAFAHSYDAIFSGRVVQGVAIGIITIAIPLYLTEVMPAKLRGRGVTMFQLFLTLGILVSSLVGLYFTPTHNWRGMFLTALIPGFILLFGSFVLVKSPRWLALKGRYDEAMCSLKVMQDDSRASLELNNIKSHLLYCSGNVPGRETLWQRKFILPLLVVFAIGILNQLTGINSILQFDAVILKNSGLNSNIGAMMGTSLVTFINFLVTCVAISIVDKFERKWLVAIGTGGVTLAMLFCSIVYFIFPESETKGLLMLAGMVGFILFFAMGPGALVWTLLSELLPSRVRSSGMAGALFLNSAASTLLASFFLPMMHHIGFGGVFLICAIATFIYFLLSIFFIPKTSGLSLEEIEEEFTLS